MRIALTLLSAALLAVPQQAPEAAPGLSIPSGALPYALDQFDGKAQLVPIHHSSVEVNNHRGANLAGSLIYARQKMTTELPGLHARTMLHTATPVFYLHMLDDPDGAGDTARSEAPTWALMQAAVVKDHRTLAQVSFNSLTQGAKRKDGLLETTVEKLPGGWLKLSPAAPLTPGEYALTPVPHAQNAFASVVYDFSFDPKGANDQDAVVRPQ